MNYWPILTRPCPNHQVPSLKLVSTSTFYTLLWMDELVEESLKILLAPHLLLILKASVEVLEYFL